METNTQPTPTRTAARRVIGLSLGLGVLIGVLTIAFAWPSSNLTPNGIPVAVVGPPGAADHVAEQLESAKPGGFDIVEAGSLEAATEMIEEREVYAALAIGTDYVDVYTASAASPVVAQLLSGVADRMAASLGEAAGQPRSVQVNAEDVVPLTADDPNGAGLAASAFPMAAGGIIIAALIGLYVRGSRRQILGAVLAPLAASAGIAAILHYALGSVEGNYWTTAGAISLTLLAAAWFVLGLTNLLGRVGVVLGGVTIVLIGNPLSGLTSAPELLPAPWGDIGQLMTPGAGATLLRSVSFFDGNGATSAILVLASWLAVGVVLFIAGTARARAKRTGVESPEPILATG